MFTLVTSEILGLKLFRKYSLYVIAQRALMVILSIGLFYFIGINGIILGMGLSFLIYSPRIYHQLRENRIDFTILRSKRGFIINNYILDISFIFHSNIDKLIIGPFFGFIVLGNYHLGMQFFNMLLILPGVMYQFLLPQEASGNSNRIVKKGFILLSIVFSLIGIFIAPIVLTYLFPKFIDAAQIIQIMSLAIIPVSLSVIFVSKFLGNEKSNVVLIGSGIFIAVIIIGMLILGQMIGINGIAITFVLAYIIQSIYFLIIDHILFKKNNL